MIDQLDQARDAAFVQERGAKLATHPRQLGVGGSRRSFDGFPDTAERNREANLSLAERLVG